MRDTHSQCRGITRRIRRQAVRSEAAELIARHRQRGAHDGECRRRHSGVSRIVDEIAPCGAPGGLALPFVGRCRRAGGGDGERRIESHRDGRRQRLRCEDWRRRREVRNQCIELRSLERRCEIHRAGKGSGRRTRAEHADRHRLGRVVERVGSARDVEQTGQREDGGIGLRAVTDDSRKRRCARRPLHQGDHALAGKPREAHPQQSPVDDHAREQCRRHRLECHGTDSIVRARRAEGSWPHVIRRAGRQTSHADNHHPAVDGQQFQRTPAGAGA